QVPPVAPDHRSLSELLRPKRLAPSSVLIFLRPTCCEFVRQAGCHRERSGKKSPYCRRSKTFRRQKCGALVGCRRLEFANPHALILPPDVTCWSPSRLRPAAACPRVLHEPAPELRWQLHRAVCEVAPFQVV